MKENKLLYSKCPCCHNYGIRALPKLGRSPLTVICMYCRRKFKAPVSFLISVGVFLVGIMGYGGYLINAYVFEFPLWVGYALVAVVWVLANYFAPLREVRDSSMKTKKVHKHSKRR